MKPLKSKFTRLRKPKALALVLFSGGLDSILAVKLMKEQNVSVEAVHFVNIFSTTETDRVRALAKRLKTRLHVIPKGEDYFKVIEKPEHGYGKNMNPCIDCRIYAFRKAWELAGKLKAHLLVTGEVLGERPMSQNMKALRLIEREAGVRGHVLRPLSAKLLPLTEAESRGIIDRDRLHAIRGRSRKKQLALARKYGLKPKDYPNPAGGCLLTDPEFSRRLKDLMKHNKLNFENAALLRFGRHFRCGKHKIIVGRNEAENGTLKKLAKEQGLVWMEVRKHKGPVTVITGGGNSEIMLATGLTVRYSDAPKDREVELAYTKGKVENMKKITAHSMPQKEIRKLKV